MSRPASGSPSDPVPNERHGLPFANLGEQLFNNKSFYPRDVGMVRGAHWTYYSKPVMFLEEEFYDLVFSASRLDRLSAHLAAQPSPGRSCPALCHRRTSVSSLLSQACYFHAAAAAGCHMPTRCNTI